eukprot:824972-Amorphochlora_amoeboformis.AAC.1
MDCPSLKKVAKTEPPFSSQLDVTHSDVLETLHRVTFSICEEGLISGRQFDWDSPNWPTEENE